MSDIQLYLLEYDLNQRGAFDIAKRTAERLETKNLKLIELIEQLDEYFNNEDGALQAKTMAYFSDILTALPLKLLSRQQRDLLNDFIVARITNGADDTANCAKALIELERLGSFDQERVFTIINTFLENASPLTRLKLQSDRFAVLSLFDVLFSKYRHALQNLYEASSDLMSRYIAFFDGEKDPRNLMIVFSILNVPMVEWDVSSHAQELFDAVFNYFPITFRPPPGNPLGITAQQLKDRLRDCISSTAHFAPYAFPALLDKLDSTSANVKRDVLQAISSCATRYGWATMNIYSITLWDALKFEVLNAQEDDLVDDALSGLREIANTLSNSPLESSLQAYIRPIAKECNEHFEDAPTKQSSAAGRIVNSVARATPSAYDLLARAVLPHLHALYQRSDSIPRRRAFLEGISQIIQASLHVYGRWRMVIDAEVSTKTGQLTPIALIEIKGQCLEILTVALTRTPITEVSFRLLALEALRDICVVRQLLSDAEISQIVKIFSDIIIQEPSYGRDDIKAAAIDDLVEIAHQKPQIIIEVAIPAFMGYLPDTDHEYKGGVTVLEAFAKLSKESQIFGTIILRLKNKLYVSTRQEASPRFVLSILLAMLYAFNFGALDPSSPTAFAPYYSDIVVPLLSDFCAFKSTISLDTPLARDEGIYDAIGRICNTIIRTQSCSAQLEISQNIYTFFDHHDNGELPPSLKDYSSSKITMLVSTQLMAALQREAIPHHNPGILLSSLVGFISSRSTWSVGEHAALQQVSLIANKFISATDTPATIIPFLSTSDTDSSALMSSTNLNRATIGTAFAILKGLALRLDRHLATILPSFLSLLTHPTYGSTVAIGLSVLLEPSDLLTKENHCLIYGMYKQRIFTLTVPALCTTFRTLSSDAQKQNYLVALAGILAHTPYTLIKPELPALVPLLLQSLSSDAGTEVETVSTTAPRQKDLPVRAAAIALFGTIIVEDPAAVQEHAGSLIGRLLAIAASSSAASTARTDKATRGAVPAKLRAAALACLASFVGSVKASALLPYRLQVIKRLAVALDDGRRAVRAEAVRCRMRWDGLGGEEE